jgi:exonuclease SbcC
VRVLELSLRNYRVFEEVDLELPARVIGIFGPNGSGKSALVESLLFGLYGRARTDRKHIRTHGVLTDCAVRVSFEHGGQQYEVRRTIRGRAHQTDAELLVGDLALATGVQEVDAEIRRLLRMDQQVFRASVFAEQKQLDAFSEVTPGKRKDMVMRLLGIKPVEQALGSARREAKQTKGNAEQLAGTLPDTAEAERALQRAREEESEAKGRAGAAREALEEATRRSAEASEGFDKAEEVRQRVEVIEADLAGLRERADGLEGRRRSLEGRIASLAEKLDAAPALEEERERLAGAGDRLAAGRRLAEAASEVAGAEKELAALPEVDAAAALKGLREAETERETAAAAVARTEAAEERARQELVAAEEALARAAEADPAQPCPTCGRPLGDDFDEYLAHCRKQVADARKRAQMATRGLKEARSARKAADQLFRAASRAGEEARTATERRNALEGRLSEARRRADSLAEPFAGEIPDLDALQRDARRAQEVDRQLAGLEAESAHLAHAERDLVDATEEHDRLVVRLRDLEREVSGLAFDAEEHARLRKEMEEARRLLDDARAGEREAADAHKAAQAAVRELQAEIRKVKEIAARLKELREEARVLDRVAILLDGFRDHLVARIGPELSREAQALFRELTNAEYDDLRIDEESLAIQIADGTDYFAMERFSGSESDLANLALRVAISLHLSRMSGADVGMMVLDEVLASLDAERKDLFVRTMGRLSNHLHQLFVITHAEQVKDQFPVSIELRKVGRRRSQAILV